MFGIYHAVQPPEDLHPMTFSQDSVPPNLIFTYLHPWLLQFFENITLFAAYTFWKNVFRYFIKANHVTGINPDYRIVLITSQHCWIHLRRLCQREFTTESL